VEKGRGNGGTGSSEIEITQLGDRKGPRGKRMGSQKEKLEYPEKKTRKGISTWGRPGCVRLKRLKGERGLDIF